MARNGGQESPKENQSKVLDGSDRESIWSILSKYKRWYFGLFTGQIVVAAIWLTQRAFADESLPGLTEKILSIWQNMAPVAISSAAIALALTDIWGTIMVIASWLEETLERRRQRQINAAVEKAVEETRNEERKAVRQFSKRLRDWNRRREAAVAAGENFEEPPPGIDEIENESTQREE